MTLILISVIVAGIICTYCYARIVVKERTDHLTAQRDAEIAHKEDWKEMAVKLTERGLLFRELPMLQEKLDAIEEAKEQGEVGDLSLEEINAEMEELDSPLHFSSQGELGRRRKLAARREALRRNADLRDRSDLATESTVNTFGLSEADMQHLAGREQ